ncbi:hypothetical protein F5883DRAFT_674388 [Diaporthe sp. PMI_573]|nr:hypothetical protein F5883DRAFT_674388 [Diaporthaceae sp. PMI_573]
MKFLSLLQVAIPALLGMASANSLVFYSAGDYCWYWPNTDHVGCYDADEHFCCRSSAPFCNAGALMDSDGITHTTYLTNGTDCDPHEEPRNYKRCTSSGNCCMYLDLDRGGGRCSAFWHFGEPSPDPNNPPMPPAGDGPCREPDFLVYTGHDGTAQKILIPDGEFEQVMEMYSRRDYNALGRYETLEGGGG